MHRLSLLIVLLALPLAGQDTEPQQRLLRWMDHIAQKQLDERAAAIAEIRTQEQAEARKKYVREKILELIGGLPDYDGPLNAKVLGRLENDKFSIEKVAYESLPRFYVTANLYLPKTGGRRPAVLLPMGHWIQGKIAAQRMAANLAAKGFVVLVFDPIGQGERQQIFDERLGASLAGGSTDQHFMPGAQNMLAGQSFARYRIWDAKRSLDYLLSRPEVDAERIGCTGCSGGGTLTTYISALDDRIKVAAPSCYMNSFRETFTGPIGDSEQSFNAFISSGLDETDYVELFAPKPWLITSTMEDYFTPEGARIVYEEARRWYRLYKAEERIRWVVGPGPHGTPLEVREAVYEWMIRWLNDGVGDPVEEDVEMYPEHQLRVTRSGQVSIDLGSRELHEIIREDLERRKKEGAQQELRAEVRRLMTPAGRPELEMKVLDEKPEPELVTQQIFFETEPGLEIGGALLLPRGPGRKPAVLVVETGEAPSSLAQRLARKGNVVLALQPRGLPANYDRRRMLGDWLANTRSWLIGRNLPGMRAYDIRRGVDLLAARSDVDPGSIRAAARETAGVWLLMAAAEDSRIQKIWLDRTPHSLRAAFDHPLHWHLHDAVIPGFGLRWDLADLVSAMTGRPVLWTDPTDWRRTIVPLEGPFQYSALGESDDRFVKEFLR